jgi:type III secretory pathway component EscS
MLFIEFIGPLVSTLIALNTQPRTDYSIEFNANLHPQLYVRTEGVPCIIMSTSIRELVYQFRYASLLVAYALIGMATVVAVIVGCVRKINQAQRSAISKRTIELEQKLLLSLCLQASSLGRRKKVDTNFLLVKIVFSKF